MKVNILGTEYKIIKDAKAEDYPKLKRCDGFTDPTLKLIVIAKYDKDDMTVENLDYYSKKVLRHELVHALALASTIPLKMSSIINLPNVNDITNNIYKSITDSINNNTRYLGGGG